jgi:hypothetical protein
VLALFSPPRRGAPACRPLGDEKAVIDVATRGHGTVPASPENGKAKVVFIETADRNALPVTTRAALDGTWLGANKDNSYFEATISPGEHHVCADWTLARRYIKDQPAFDVFTAEPGKVTTFRSESVG